MGSDSTLGEKLRRLAAAPDFLVLSVIDVMQKDFPSHSSSLPWEDSGILADKIDLQIGVYETPTLFASAT